MLTILKEYDRSSNYAAYLLVDDADCRFCAGERAAYLRQREAWAQDVAEALGRPTPLFVCLAFQEVEAWLLSDWDNTFGLEYRQQDPALRRALGEALGSAALNAPEEIGCPQKSSGEGCTVKVSEEIQRVVASSSETLYSKAVHGQAMLRRLNADAVAQRCRQFREDLTTLREGLRALAITEDAAKAPAP